MRDYRQSLQIKRPVCCRVYFEMGQNWEKLSSGNKKGLEAKC